MSIEEIHSEIKRLNKSHRITRWLYILIGLALIVFSHFLIEIASDGNVNGILKAMAVGKAHLFVGPLGASMIGYILSIWHGTKELKLLNSIVEIENT